MEHIFFEVQLCIKISIFKEISNIDILIILCLGTGLQVPAPPLLGQCRSGPAQAGTLSLANHETHF